MKRGRNVEIAMATYIAVALSLIYGFGRVTLFSVISASVSFAFMIFVKGLGEPDSWGWSKATSKALLVGAAISLIGGIPLWGVVGEITCPLGVTRFWQISALLFTTLIMAVAVYLRSYLSPGGNQSVSSKSLQLEHQQWLHMLRALIVLTGVIFIAGSGMTYLIRPPSELPSELKLPPMGTLVILSYFAFGWLGWILRPIYGRLGEIRDHVDELELLKKRRSH